MDKISRPTIVPSESHEVKTGCKKLFVTIGSVEGKPIEIFITAGHTGECVKAFNEALGRTISIGLQYGVPLEEYISQLSGIQCEHPLDFPKESRVFSCPDALAKTLKGAIHP
jgi:ribonucleoside-diphosphate reductase alpha chain